MTHLEYEEDDHEERRHDLYREKLIIETARQQVMVKCTVHECDYYVKMYVVYVIDERDIEPVPLHLGLFSDIRTRAELEKDVRAWFAKRGIRSNFDVRLDTTFAPRL